MRSAPSLSELQESMRWIVTDPRGVEVALADPHPKDAVPIARYTAPPINALTSIADLPPLTRIERLDIYAEAYFARIVEVLTQDFPVTARILEEDGFLKLVADYLKFFPSHSPNLGDIGEHLPRFIQSHAFGTQFLYLSDLVKFEWDRVVAFYAPSQAPLDVTELQAVSPESWDDARFDLDPSLHLHSSSWDILSLWKGSEEAAAGQFQWVTFRDATDHVQSSALNEEDFVILAKMASGSTLGELCLEFGSEINFPQWISHGWIRKIRWDS